MAYFRMIPSALPQQAVEDARALALAVTHRTGVNKFSIASGWTRPADREQALTIARTFLQGPAAAPFRDRFAAEPALCLDFTTIRHQAAGTASAVGWHLDLGFVQDDSPFLVSWTALSDVGTTRPGLDVCVPTGVAFALSDFLHEWLKRRSDGRSLEFVDDELVTLLGRDAWATRSLQARAGDAAVFDQFTLHRTQVMSDSHEERFSIEFRMIDLDRLPAFQRVRPCVCARLGPDGELRIMAVKNGQPTAWSTEAFLHEHF